MIIFMTEEKTVKENKDNYRTVRIPSELYDQVQQTVNNSGLGYKSVAEFVKDAIRRRLDEMSTKRSLNGQFFTWHTFQQNIYVYFKIFNYKKERDSAVLQPQLQNQFPSYNRQ